MKNVLQHTVYYFIKTDKKYANESERLFLKWSSGLAFKLVDKIQKDFIFVYWADPFKYVDNKIFCRYYANSNKD